MATRLSNPTARWVLATLAGLVVGIVVWRVLRVESGWEGVPLGVLGGIAVAAIVYMLVAWLTGA
jgi:dolichyl-phosphate-mannose--protein O-mannosyl transferase